MNRYVAGDLVVSEFTFHFNNWSANPYGNKNRPKDFLDAENHYCGQSYKASMIINYNSRVVPDLKIPRITTLES